MKRLCLLTASATLLLGSVCYAKVTPAHGYGQIGLSSVVLCNSLTLYADKGLTSMQKLSYGDRPIVMEQEDGWAYVALGDSEDSPKGWVNESYLAIDPAWYTTEGDTPVYSWDDTSAPKIGLLDSGEEYPILRDDGDWIIISLRGATGWIHNPVRGSQSSQPASSSQDSQSSSAPSYLGTMTVFDEMGDVYTLYEGSDGFWRDRSGTRYTRVSDTQFQAYEGTKRLSVNDTSHDDDYIGEVEEDFYNQPSLTVYDEYGTAYTIYQGSDGYWREEDGTTYIQLSDTEFQVKEGTKRLSTELD